MDLSRSQNPNELARITRGYGRYFGDVHHMDSAMAAAEPDRVIWDDRVMSELYEARKADYFYGEISRRSLSDFDWSAMSEEARFEAARRRTDFHNRLLKHRETYEENITILSGMEEMCRDNGVAFRMVVFPSNRYYRHFLNPRLGDAFEEQQRRSLSKNTAVLDLVEDERFDSILDFVDPDHLNDVGADKMTGILRQWLEVS